MKTLFQGLRMRKRGLLSALCIVTLVYAGVQMYVQEEYSPLQLLSSVENEASRLLRFISQPQAFCNDSLATGNSSRWLICLDPEIGVPSLKSDDQNTIVYSIGPLKDYSFEQVTSWNLSAAKLYIFSHQKNLKHMHTNPSKTFSFNSVIVPDDPADFARNSFESQTLNTVMQTLHHENIDVLKLDSFIDSVQAFDVLRFMMDGSVLQNVKELHFVVKLDKLEEDFIYSWYRVLYALFNTAGFRLFHTSASDMLCLQDTIMESCTYYLSWVKRPPPHVFVMYPPAIDGSKDNEEDRLLNYLQSTKSKEILFTPTKVKLASKRPSLTTDEGVITLALSSAVLEKDSQSCNMILIRSSSSSYLEKVPVKECETHNLVYSTRMDGTVSFQAVSPLSNRKGITENVDLKKIVMSSTKNIVFIDLEENWNVLNAFSTMGLPKYVDQLIVQVYIFPARGRSVHNVLRTRYSELRRLEEFSLSLVSVKKIETTSLKMSADGDLYSLNFVKSSIL